jgi:tRNA threonylcarbamoyladenosine biosynthesis protein TsaB
MLILALDTSSSSGSLALLRETSVVRERRISPGEPFAASLLRDTRELLDSARVHFEEIELFAVDAGPGSFTGLRTGLATVKGWAEVYRRPVAAVSGLEAMAIQVSESAVAGSLIAAVMDAKRGQVFGGVFRKVGDRSGALERVGEETVSTAVEFLESLRPQAGGASGLILACAQPEIIRLAMEGQDTGSFRIEAVSEGLAPFIGRLGYMKALRGEVVDALHLDANYIRRSDAEMNWRGAESAG